MWEGCETTSYKMFNDWSSLPGLLRSSRQWVEHWKHSSFTRTSEIFPGLGSFWGVKQCWKVLGGLTNSERLPKISITWTHEIPDYRTWHSPSKKSLANKEFSGNHLHWARTIQEIQWESDHHETQYACRRGVDGVPKFQSPPLLLSDTGECGLCLQLLPNLETHLKSCLRNYIVMRTFPSSVPHCHEELPQPSAQDLQYSMWGWRLYAALMLRNVRAQRVSLMSSDGRWRRLGKLSAYSWSFSLARELAWLQSFEGAQTHTHTHTLAL